MEENKIHKEINVENQKKIHDLLDRYGVKFGIYKNNEFNCQVNMKMSQIFPNISTDFHGAFAFLNVYQKTVVSRDE